MPESIKHTYSCSICGQKFSDVSAERAKVRAEKCEKSHGEIVYVPLLKSDIQRLLSFIVTKNEGLITTTLWRTLKAYRGLK